jgi:hypothetical protein
MARYLQEHLSFSQAQVKLLSEDAVDGFASASLEAEQLGNSNQPAFTTQVPEA